MAGARGVALAFAAGGRGGPDPGDDLSVVTDKEWKRSTKDEKLSFINGVTTVIELEKEVQGLAPGASGSSLVDGWVHGLASMRLDEIVCRLQARPASTCPLLNKGL